MTALLVDDILEIVDRGQIQNLTDPLNQVDPTENIQLTFEEESDGEIAFLDTKIIRKPDGSIKLDIYRKPTHTNQYLQFSSHHPLHWESLEHSTAKKTPVSQRRQTR